MALRKHKDSLSTLDELSNNSGNFLELLKFIEKYNPVLEKHLTNPSKKIASDGFIKNILEAMEDVSLTIMKNA